MHPSILLQEVIVLLYEMEERREGSVSARERGGEGVMDVAMPCVGIVGNEVVGEGSGR